MTDANKGRIPRRFDAISVLLLSCLAAAAVGVGAALIYFGYFTPWEFALWLVVCLAFLAVGLPGHVNSAPKNTQVHGSARPATETEAQDAARGAAKARDIHDQHFPD